MECRYIIVGMPQGLFSIGHGWMRRSTEKEKRTHQRRRMGIDLEQDPFYLLLLASGISLRESYSFLSGSSVALVHELKPLPFFKSSCLFFYNRDYRYWNWNWNCNWHWISRGLSLLFCNWMVCNRTLRNSNGRGWTAFKLARSQEANTPTGSFGC